MRDSSLPIFGVIAGIIALSAAVTQLVTARRPQQQTSTIDLRNRKRIAVGVGTTAMAFAVVASIVLAQALPRVRAPLLALAVLFLVIGVAFLARIIRKRP
jgi:uncharacterized membrane protein YfcA